jgi:hypothetical protein
MSTENIEIVEPTETSLDDFAADFFGRKEAAPEPTNSEEVKEEQEESDAPSEDTHDDGEVDTSAPDDDDETGEEEDSNKEEAPKPKKNRFQERIDELNGKFRETERKLNEALQKLAEKENETKKTEPTVQKTVEDDGPAPTDTNEDGSEKYPLGEFDPAYIKDLMKYTLEKERDAQSKAFKEQQEERAKAEAREALQASWNEKLVPAQERYPDFQTKGQELLTSLDGLDEAYGDYLATTIMDMEFGPDVFYYLANNVDEAQKIIHSGAQKATIALGRLEAKFAAANEEKEKARPKVSKAPPPPNHLNKGSAVVAPAIRGDEKDINLDDFARELFKKPGRGS